MPFIKTNIARKELTSEDTRLTARERQIVLLCTGTRPTERLVDIFGAGVLDELKALEQRGLVRLHELVPTGSDAPDAPAAAPQPVAAVRAPAAAPAPVATPAAPSSPDAGLSTRAWLLGARGAALAVLAQIGPDDEEVRGLIENYQDVEGENDILMLLEQTMRATLRLAGKKTTVKVSTALAYLLPDAAIPRLLDCMLESSDPELVAWLYERLLAGSDTLPTPWPA